MKYKTFIIRGVYLIIIFLLLTIIMSELYINLDDDKVVKEFNECMKNMKNSTQLTIQNTIYDHKNMGFITIENTINNKNDILKTVKFLSKYDYYFYKHSARLTTKNGIYIIAYKNDRKMTTIAIVASNYVYINDKPYAVKSSNENLLIEIRKLLLLEGTERGI